MPVIHLNHLIYIHGVTMWQMKILLTPLHFILSMIAKATAFQVPTAQNTMIVLLIIAVLMLLRLTLLLKLIKVSIFVHLFKAIGSSLITCKDCISMALLIILLYIHILVYRLLWTQIVTLRYKLNIRYVWIITYRDWKNVEQEVAVEILQT